MYVGLASTGDPSSFVLTSLPCVEPGASRGSATAAVRVRVRDSASSADFEYQNAVLRAVKEATSANALAYTEQPDLGIPLPPEKSYSTEAVTFSRAGQYELKLSVREDGQHEVRSYYLHVYVTSRDAWDVNVTDIAERHVSTARVETVPLAED